MRIGLVVNPVAGLGGAVGLKGTDGPGIVAEARARGAEDRAGPRTRTALARLADRAPGTRLVAGPGPLGADWAEGLDLEIEAVMIPDATGTARDTKAVIRAIGPCDQMVFAGGDGTARDVAATLAEGTPMLGIPSGVKMHSGVFAVSPGAAGALLADLVTDPARVTWRGEVEIMDIDEVALRAGVLAPRLYGLATTPGARSLMQAAKGGPPGDGEGAVRAAAAAIAATMAPGILYVVGPGTSAGAVTRAAGFEPTVLGVDALLDGKRVARDATGAELSALARDRPVRIVLGVTGQQGFLLGRGNQQIGTDLIHKAGREGMIVIASPEKLATLAAPRLLVDTGDAALDDALSGFHRVRTGAGRATMMRIGTA
ncbi:NAD(+)/NADH kinase [uncultured Jannaschia sp.]|uniref:ATP-NAD kinase family protein n=1 Tax=uncultured Jannaschia sp. TaxID=293347 RepID=UPI002615740B|nr:NAD(+)/NADH kinase [uncultured Jannaschia sp.]